MYLHIYLGLNEQDQFISRGDMWRFTEATKNLPAHRGKVFQSWAQYMMPPYSLFLILAPPKGQFNKRPLFQVFNLVGIRAKVEELKNMGNRTIESGVLTRRTKVLLF